MNNKEPIKIQNHRYFDESDSLYTKESLKSIKKNTNISISV
jgi:hypothetical protein